MRKKGRGQPRPRTNCAAIGLVPLHSGKGRTRKGTYWVLAGPGIARRNATIRHALGRAQANHSQSIAQVHPGGRHAAMLPC